MIKMKRVWDELPPENQELLVLSPAGVFHLASWRPAYNIFTCQNKSENSDDWYYTTLEIEKDDNN